MLLVLLAQLDELDFVSYLLYCLYGDKNLPIIGQNSLTVPFCPIFQAVSNAGMTLEIFPARLPFSPPSSQGLR